MSPERGVRVVALVLAALGVMVISCSEDPGRRPQTLLVIDTDLPVTTAAGEVPVAAVDTLRIDVIEGTRTGEGRELLVANVSDWPVSLGVVGPARLRLRLFRASLATGAAGKEGALLSPRAEVSVDRLVDVPAEATVRRRGVVLTGDCTGFVADLGRGTTCVGAGARDAPASAALLDDPPSTSRIGTWKRLSGAPCTVPADPERRCVKGGYDVVGDLTLGNIVADPVQPVPLRAVVVSPMLVDRTEVTVRRYRELRGAGWTPPDAPVMADPSRAIERFCTFLGDDIDTNDALPLNCVGHATARSFCLAGGGDLPSEAQWEHAARGGTTRRYPWGSEPATCCRASVSHAPEPLVGGRQCGERPLEPAGSHDGTLCSGGGDVTPDGIHDLGGSLSELVRDRADRGGLGDPVGPCHTPGLRTDPVCNEDDPTAARLGKGGDWTAGPDRARPGFVFGVTSRSVVQGFRCVYPGGALP